MSKATAHQQHESWKAALQVTYIVAAARQDAYHAGKDQPLKDAIVPHLKQFKEDGKFAPIMDAIKSVLGSEWQPTGQFAEALIKLEE